MSHAPAERAALLREQLHRALHEYYVLDRPTLSDRDYDLLFRELVELERGHPDLCTPDSPTLRVGAEPQSAFVKHRHMEPMLSLGNAFDDDELRAWEQRMLRQLGADTVSAGYTAELKIDGAAVSLSYENGVLVAGATRGNGVIGENVTPNLRTVRDVPLRLAGAAVPARVEIRGEIYLPFDHFERMNEARARAGEPVFANPRNAAAGSLRQLDPAVTAGRPLRFFGYSAVVADQAARPFTSQWELLDMLVSWGVAVAPHRLRAGTLAEVTAWTHDVEHSLRGTLNFAIDGAVVKVDSLRLHEELGVVGGREPRWAIARKFPPDIAETRLHRIDVNVGRTGMLNPFAVLEPVEIGGTVVRLATLHNEALVIAKDLREGDMVQVKRAGDVIPQVVAPLPDRRDGTERPWRMPTKCPACGTPVVKEEDEAAAYCPNVACPGRQLEGLVYFASRGAMDIRGLSYARIEQLINEHLISDAGDLYALRPEQLRELAGFAARSAEALVAAIQASREQPLSRLLTGLGIPHVGEMAARLLARHFGSMRALSLASEDDVAAIRGVGEVIAHSARAYFSDSSAQQLVGKLEAAGVNMTEPTHVAAGGTLAGCAVVITGTLPTLTRQQATELVETNGGRVTSSVSKATRFVLAGADAGTKLEKARALGTEVIDEAEFFSRIGQ